MPRELFEFSEPARITVGAIGEPGHRVFLLQVSEGEQSINLKLEKEQVYALAKGIDNVLEELAQREVAHALQFEEPPPEDMILREPIEAEFVVGQMGLVYDEQSNRLVLILQELTEDDEPAVAHLWATLGQMSALSKVAKDIVARGRPICPLCHRPIDPEGHFCPDGNGHGTQIGED